MSEENEKKFVGIQGDQFSFNHQAIKTVMLDALGETDYAQLIEQMTEEKIAFLCNSYGVLLALLEGDISYGQLATNNSIGGPVIETIEAMLALEGAADCMVVAETIMPINQCLIVRDDAPHLNDIERIMSHPQSIKQCSEYIDELRLTNPLLKVESGNGEQIDHARVARDLAKGDLPATVAVIGPEVLADHYSNLRVVKEGINQKGNLTVFALLALKETLERDFPDVDSEELQTLGELCGIAAITIAKKDELVMA